MEGLTVPTENTDDETPMYPWTIYPIFHLKADWISEEPEHFDLDIQLIRADDGTLKRLAEKVGEGAYPLIFPNSFDPQYGAVRWLLAVRTPESSQDMSSERIGFSFKDKLESAICNSFLTCLKVVRSTAAVCPISCPAIVRGSHVEFGENRFFDVVTADAPRCDWPERFEEADLPKIRQVWSGLVQLRNLARWRTSLFREEFFASLDEAAKAAAERYWRSQLKDRLETVPPEARDKMREQFDVFVRALSSKTGWDTPYGEALYSLFNEEEQKAFNIGTRIGRAVGIFEEGVHLPHLHAFLSACLALETLFTLGEGEVTHKLATRLAKVVVDKGTAAERLELFKRARKVYTARSDVVHGKTAITGVKEDFRKDAFNLTRMAIQKILAERRYLDLYTAPTDKDNKGQLWDFFESLDLG
jgi:hypothetical protein